MQALQTVQHAIPVNWRYARVDRSDLDRFVFEAGDVIVALGPDGLVANIAKYLDNQIVIGLNPMPDIYDGVLVRFAPEQAAGLMKLAVENEAQTEKLTMVVATLDNGQLLNCLNEVYVGHCSHQSSRYTLRYLDRQERQSSSGLIVATGTGATGWARSLSQMSQSSLKLPEPTQQHLAFFVREAWLSIATGTSLVEGLVDAEHPLTITSEMDTGGVVFGDGIETDFLSFGYGQTLQVRPGNSVLNLFTL